VSNEFVGSYHEGVKKRKKKKRGRGVSTKERRGVEGWGEREKRSAFERRRKKKRQKKKSEWWSGGRNSSFDDNVSDA
jgi:hypothetical protein